MTVFRLRQDFGLEQGHYHITIILTVTPRCKSSCYSKTGEEPEPSCCVKMLSRLPLRAWKWYMTCLETHPWKTQLISTGALLGAGDFIAQQYVEKVPLREHDVVRTARMAAVGTIVIGPIFHVWYSTLDKRFGHKSPGNAMRKMTVDQSILAPVFLVLFYGAVGIVERRTIKQISDKIYEEFYPNMVVNYKVWPAVQFLNFYLFPAHLRVLVVNVVSLFWNTYLAWTSHKELGHSVE